MRLLKKEIGIEEIISRIPGHFPYFEFNEFGDCEVHKASDSPMGCYGKIADAMKLDVEKDVYYGSYTYMPYQYRNKNNGLLLSYYNYSLLSEDSIEDYDVYEYVDPEQTLLSFEWNKLEEQLKNKYTPNGFVNNQNGIMCYADYENLLNRSERKNYEKFSYISIIEILKDDDTEIADDYELMYYSKEDSIYYKNREEYNRLEEEEKSKYVYCIYGDTSTEISVEEFYNIDGDETFHYLPYRYIKKDKLSIDKFIELEEDEQHNYEPYQYALIISYEEFKNKLAEKCDTYLYRPYSFKHKTNSNKIIYLREYRDLSVDRRGDYEIYSYLLNNTEVISLERYETFLNDVSQHLYKIYSYINREGNVIQEYAEGYFPQYTKLKLIAQNIYSYRTLMTCYYDLKIYNEYKGEGCDEFIIFIENGIGRWSLQRAVEEFNTKYVEYSTLSENENLYPDDNNVTVEHYNRILNNDLITVSDNSQLPIFYKKNEELINNEEYYKYKDYITIEEYKNNTTDVREIYAPHTYARLLTSIEITQLGMNKDMFECGQYVKVYEENESGCVVFQYQNEYYDEDVIDFMEYGELNEVGQISYMPYYRENTDFNNIITTDAYETLTDDEKQNYTIIYILNDSVDNIIDNDMYNALSYYGKENYVPYNYFKPNSNETISEIEFSDLVENDKTNYVCKCYRISSTYAIITENYYDALGAYNKSRYEPFIYIDPTGSIPQYITAEEYNNIDNDFEKSKFYVYAYGYEYEEGNVDVIASAMFEEMPFFGKEAYRPLLYKIYVTGTDYDEELYGDLRGNKINFTEEQFLVPSWFFIASVTDIRNYLINLRIKIKPFIEGKTTNQRLCCLADEYWFRGGDDMIRLLTMLINISNEVAEYYYTLSEVVLNEETEIKSIKNAFSFNLSLIANARDNGYLTPYINYWEPGETLNIGDIFTYHDKYGEVTTYIVNGYVYEVKEGDSDYNDDEDDTVDGDDNTLPTANESHNDTNDGNDSDTDIAVNDNEDEQEHTTQTNNRKYKLRYMDGDVLREKNYIPEEKEIPNGIMIYHEDDETITLNTKEEKCVKKYEKRTFPDFSGERRTVMSYNQNNRNSRIVTIEGNVESKLKNNRRYVSYFNAYGDMERTTKNEDWLFYYRKNLVIPTISSTTNDSLPTTIHEDFDLNIGGLSEIDGYKYKEETINVVHNEYAETNITEIVDGVEISKKYGTWTGKKYITKVDFEVGGTTNGHRRIKSVEVIFDDNVSNEKVVFSDRGYSNGEEIQNCDCGNFSIKFNKGSSNYSPKYYNDGGSIRVYRGSTFSINSNGRKTINKIQLVFGSGDGSNNIITNAFINDFTYILLYNIEAYGNVIDDITYDKDKRLIKFNYTIGKHLTQKCVVPKVNNRLLIEEMSDAVYLIDDVTYLKDNSGVKYVDTYEYYEGGELDNLIRNNQKCYKKKNDGVLTKYERFVKYEDYITMSDTERVPYVKCEQTYTFAEVDDNLTEDCFYYPFMDKYVRLVEDGESVTYVKTITEDEYNDLPFFTFDEYISNVDENEISSKKYEFFATDTINTFEKRIGYNTTTIEYIKSQFETQHSIDDYDSLMSPTFKEDYLSVTSYAPSVDVNVDINRGNNTAFERHLRLSEVKTLTDMVNFRNGSFFIMKDNSNENG